MFTPTVGLRVKKVKLYPHWATQVSLGSTGKISSLTDMFICVQLDEKPNQLSNREVTYTHEELQDMWAPEVDVAFTKTDTPSELAYLDIID